MTMPNIIIEVDDEKQHGTKTFEARYQHHQAKRLDLTAWQNYNKRQDSSTKK